MFSKEVKRLNFFLSWPLLLLQLLALVALSIVLDKPVGSLRGAVGLEKEGNFHLYSTDLGHSRVYAIAIGPRDGDSSERGVWVNPDGSFKIDQLPVGEYQLKVRAPGYTTEFVEGLLVEEAQTAEVPHVVKMEILQPSISIATNVRVFTSKDQPSFWINGTGLAHAKVRAYKKDILAFRKMPSNYVLNNTWSLSEQDYHAPFKNPLAKEKPVQVFDRELPPSYDDSSTAEFKFDKPLPPGDYILEAEGVASNNKDMNGAIAWFTVTDIGLVIKHAPDQALVRAINIVTLKPVANIPVSMGYDLSLNTSKRTNKDGFVSFPMTPEYSDSYEDKHLSFEGVSGANHAYSDVNWYISANNKYMTYFYTDRPVYRLGQTVYFKGLVREKTITSYKNPGSSLTISYECKDPDGNTLSAGDLVTSKHGTFHGQVSVPKDNKTGGYNITFTYPDGKTSYESFEIAQYRKPEYEVTVTPVTPRVVAGDHAKAKVHATYYFGGPVANARVKYTINSSYDSSARADLNRKPKYYSWFDDWDTSSSSNYSSGGDVISEGYTQTDGNGDALIEFDTKKIELDRSHPYDSSYSDKDYSINCEVTDISRLTVTGSGSLVATEGDFALFVSPKSYVYSVGDPLTVDVKALTYEGKPVVNQKVSLRVSRFGYDSSKHEYRNEQVESEVPVVTDSEGKATASIPVKDQWPSDTFYISGMANDAENHLIFDSNTVWIANSRYPYVRYGEEAQNEALSIKLDKAVYKPGETAKVMITAPFEGNEGADAIISVEGKHIYNYKVVPMNATAKMVEVPLTNEFAPNVFVNVTIVDKNHKMYTQDQLVMVSPENNFLSFKIETDKAKYKPGETVHYTVTAKHNDGAPAEGTEISLGVVDESIYAIRAENAGDIQKSFYVRTENSVTTSCSFPEEYSGGPDKVEPKVRKDFRDTAAWVPELVTDKNGVAKSDIKLPDNLTTWRATVRGIDMKTDVGETTQKIISSQDLILRLALPRFFSQGDEGLVTAVVHNYSDKTQDVKVTLSMTNQLKTDTPLTQTLHLAPEKADRFSWPVQVVSSGSATIRAKAIGQTAGDAMETKLPVRPLGIPAFSFHAGLVTDNTQTITIPYGLSADAERSTAKAQLNLTSSTIGPVIGNYAALIDYPYGCTEQTMSRLMPSIVAKTLNQKLHQPISPADAATFEVVYKQAMDKLRTYHHNDGSWGWWQYDQGNPYLTALVVEGLHMLTDVGYNEAPEAKTGVDWMKTESNKLFKVLTDPKIVKDDWFFFYDNDCDLARMLYAESLYRNAPPVEMAPWFTKKINEFTPETLTYLTMTYHNTGDDVTGQKFYDRLIFLANTSKEFTDWEYNSAMRKKLSITNDWLYSYRYTFVETTALALRAVLTMEPNNLERIESIKKYILLQRGNDGWGNTKTTAEVFRALLQDELQARQQYGEEAITARVAFNAKTLVEFISNPNDLNKSQLNQDLPIPKEPGQLTIQKEGNGRLYWSTMVTYRRNLKPGDHVNEKGLPQGLKITRSFFRLKPKAVTSDGTIHYNLEEIKDGEVKAGETIMMKVFVETPVRVPYIMLDAALPSGAEVVEDSPQEGSATDDSGAAAATVEGDWGAPWWTHKDVLDDRIVFFGTTMEKGKSEFHTMLRLELPGKINLNPVSLEGMYTDQVRGYSDLASFHVSE